MSDSISQQPVTGLAGIGPQTAIRLRKMGIHTLQDLLFHLPLRYQDLSRITAIAALQAGCSALVCGEIEFVETPQRGRHTLVCRIRDHSGSLNLRFFHFSARQLQLLQRGRLLGCYGELRHGYAGLEMAHPEYRIVQQAEQLLDPLLRPVYPVTEGLNQASIRKAVRQALERCLQHDADGIRDWLPAELLQRHGYPALAEAIRHLHHPPPAMATALTTAQRPASLQRLAFEELLAHHLALLQGRLHYREVPAPVLAANAAVRSAVLQRLPFALTAAQQRVVAEIDGDCGQAQAMLRLLQGDVGSGKTVVAALAAMAAVAAGCQAALMAPTELLAEQHFRTFSHWCAGLARVAFLSGQQKGRIRAATLAELADGTAQIVIGTHALFQDSVQFQRLGLIIIDEQHRFGVDQRLALREKGRTAGLRPHQLIMTATPIPRTLAMLQYSDLDVSVIDELPPGRQPVTTSVLSAERRGDIIARLEQWLTAGRQAYWVCTLIEESEQLQCEAAENTAASLAAALPAIKVGLVHGRMKAQDKDGVMQAFQSGQLALLVATTVIEVGVDVPNAGLMVIENAERLGLSQLHQLRGRVGRGNHASFCLLLYQPPLSQIGRQRLEILKASNDGFVIAEQDLSLRGPGEVLGTRQTGQMQFKIADLDRDSDLLPDIPQAARLLLQRQPDAVPALIERWIGHNHHYAEV